LPFNFFFLFVLHKAPLEQPAADVLGAARVIAHVTDALFWPILECAAADMLLRRETVRATSVCEREDGALVPTLEALCAEIVRILAAL
jgi:hypothetical protein